MVHTDNIPCPYDTKKWYSPKEIMPYPKRNLRKIASFFKIDVDGEGDDLEDLDDTPLDMPKEESDFGCGISIRLYFNLDRKNGVFLFGDYLYDCLPQFLKDLSKKGFANWQDDMYDNVYILAWKKKNNIEKAHGFLLHKPLFCPII